MNIKLMMDFLADLAAHNDREWFHAHKAEYQAATHEFEELVRRLTLELRAGDPDIPLLEPKELTFKLMRDTRFSADKSPYNPSFRAHIGPQGKLPIPVGYYLMLQPGGRTFLGGGLFADMFKDATAMLRDHIAAHGDEWQGTLEDPDFARRFTVAGTALKKVPQGYDPGHPQAEWLKYKSWYLEVPVADETVLGDGFVDYAVETFLAMKAFNGFLNRGLEGFRMPER